MISVTLQRWMPIIFVLPGIVYSQMPMPYPIGPPMGPPMGYGVVIPAPPPQPIPVPMPVPMPVPVAVMFPETTASTTTSTTTKATTTTQRPSGPDDDKKVPDDDGGKVNNGNNTYIPYAIPVPFPMVQIAVPSFIPQMCPGGNCPPCPPCSCNPCTPSFFSYCSPCHQKCRCKNIQDAPVPPDPRNGPPQPFFGPAFPMPLPMPAPPPIVLVPFPHHFSRKPRRDDDKDKQKHKSSTEVSADSSAETSECTDTSSGSDSNASGKSKKDKNNGNYGIYRRNLQQMKKNLEHIRKTRDSEGAVRPILTYVAKDGEIKLRTSLSRDEATALLDHKNLPGVQFLPGRDEDNRPSLLMISPHMDNKKLNDAKKHILIRIAHSKIGNMSVPLKTIESSPSLTMTTR